MVKKWTGILIFIFFFFSAQFSLAEPVQQSQTNNYSIKFNNFYWYEKFLINLFGYEFLSWKEAQIALVMEYDDLSGSHTVTSVIITNDKQQEFFTVIKTSVSVSGFANVDKKREFTEPAASAMRDVWNYFLDQNYEILDISASPLHHNGEGSLYCRFKKEKTADGYIEISPAPSDKKGECPFSNAKVLPGNPPVIMSFSFETKNKVILLQKKPQ